MNLLQQFMAEANRQTRTINQEEVVINGSKFFGSFGDPQMLPVMTRHGYEDQIVQPFLAPVFTSGPNGELVKQFASPPLSHQKLTRCINNVEYFIQMVDAKDPVVFTFILTDREL